jgi:4-amino-4-deoxy-L-arabinose transferase-like glycosyltransferase/tetratricopeptide (TPR) repeat protein
MVSMSQFIKQTQFRPLLVLTGLFFIALAVRGIYFYELAQIPYFDTVLPVYDHSNFDQGALSFAGGDGLARSPNNSYSPLYKYFLGSIYFLFGRNFYVIYGLQFTMGALGAVLIFLIGKRLFDTRVGLLAFAGFALYSTEIIYEGIILRAAFITFFGILSFYMLIRLRESSGPLMLVGCALALSLFFQSRPNTFLCLPFVIFYIHKYVFENWEPQSRLRGWGMFLVPLLLSFIPLLVQCYLVHGRFVFFDSSGPTAFMAGNFINYPGAGFDPKLLVEFQKMHQLENISPVSFIFQQVMMDPAGFLKMIWRKLFFYFNDLEGASNLSIYLYLENSKVLPFMISHFSLFSALGLIGIVLVVHKREKVFLLYAFLASLILSVVIFHVVSRFRVPSAPFLILFAAYAVGRACTWWGRKEYTPVAVFAVAFLVLFYGLRVPEGYTKVRYVDYCNWSSAYLTEEKWFNVEKAETYAIQCLESKRQINSDLRVTSASLASIYKLYGSYLIQRQDELAGKILQHAFSVDPFDSELYRMYSDFQSRRNSTVLAIHHLHISRIANKNDGAPLRNLVGLYYSSDSDPGRTLAALKAVLPFENDPKTAKKVKDEIRRLEVLLETKREEVKLSAAKARKYLSEKKWKAALEEYEKLNAFNASDAKLLIEQGMAYEYLNDEERALDSFYDALLIEGKNPELNKNMGNYYLSVGNLVLAILHWTRYLETSQQDEEYFSIQERLQFYSQQLKMKSLPKQIFGLSQEQNRHLYKIYRNMKVQLG